MKYLLSIALLISLQSIAQKNPDAIIGRWESVEKNLIVDVYKQGNDFKAKVVWFHDEDDTITPIHQWLDIKNPDKKLRSRTIIGSDILSGLVYNTRQNKWVNGKIYDATSGRTWDATVWLTSPNTLNVRGFYLVRWLGKTLYFVRVSSVPISK